MAWEVELLSAPQRIHTPWLDRIMVFFTTLANHGELWLFLAFLFLCVPRTRRLGLGMFLSIGLGFITGNLILKNLFARSRPCWVRPEVPLLVRSPGDYSFPSGHTLVSFEGAVSIWYHDRRWGAAALAAAAVIAFSRLYLFVHFPTDVGAGLLLGIFHAWAAGQIMAFAGRERKS